MPLWSLCTLFIDEPSILGFDTIHTQLTDLLINKPYLFREQKRLIENLAKQGFSYDIWRLIDSPTIKNKATYISAMALRAVRFIRQLELDEWKKLYDLMFTADDVSKLMEG